MKSGVKCGVRWSQREGREDILAAGLELLPTLHNHQVKAVIGSGILCMRCFILSDSAWVVRYRVCLTTRVLYRLIREGIERSLFIPSRDIHSWTQNSTCERREEKL